MGADMFRTLRSAGSADALDHARPLPASPRIIPHDAYRRLRCHLPRARGGSRRAVAHRGRANFVPARQRRAGEAACKAIVQLSRARHGGTQHNARTPPDVTRSAPARHNSPKATRETVVRPPGAPRGARGWLRVRRTQVFLAAPARLRLARSQTRLR